MDFLKTLLMYMAATFVVAVESTSTPSVTPVPTPAPVPSVTVAAVTEAVTEEPTVTPAPTVSVTPVPVPTITPNTRAYHNLATGAKGADVRRLQERLIELGYLPEGSADGAYGRQTAAAVRRFQYYNGLTQDGIAGRTTQTNLFENPDAASYPQETATPEPETVPETKETAGEEKPSETQEPSATGETAEDSSVPAEDVPDMEMAGEADGVMKENVPEIVLSSAEEDFTEKEPQDADAGAKETEETGETEVRAEAEDGEAAGTEESQEAETEEMEETGETEEAAEPEDGEAMETGKSQDAETEEKEENGETEITAEPEDGEAMETGKSQDAETEETEENGETEITAEPEDGEAAGTEAPQGAGTEKAEETSETEDGEVDETVKSSEGQSEETQPFQIQVTSLTVEEETDPAEEPADAEKEGTDAAEKEVATEKEELPADTVEPTGTETAEPEDGEPETAEAVSEEGDSAAVETDSQDEGEVENVDLDEEEKQPEDLTEPEKTPYEDLAGWIVLNDSGEAMQWTELEDGVPVVRSVRLQRREEDQDIRISLDDVVRSVEGWILTDEGDSLVLEAQGYTLALLNEQDGFVAMVDGTEMNVWAEDFSFDEGHYIRAEFLTRALEGEWIWDEEEDTLMLRIPSKNTYQD